MPALREHREDIIPLVDHFLARFARKVGKRFTGVSPEMMRQLQAYSWPGNVRELQNVIERATILSEGPLLGMDDPLQSPLHDDKPIPAGITLEEVERSHILQVLASAGGVIEGPEGAAAQLGLPPSTLRSRMAKLGISRSPNE
jgi:DNA-binding NtrC family response regulator